MIKSKHNVIIFHGHDGTQKNHWHPWLKENLESLGVSVISPDFPLEEKQNPQDWMKFFESIKDMVNENTILVGHSLGTAMIFNVLASLEKPVFGIVLVGGFGKAFGDDEVAKTCNAFVENLPWRKIRKNAGNIKIFASTNDPEIPQEISIHLGKALQSPIQFIENAGHFCKGDGYEKFPRLLEYLKTQIYLTYGEFKKLDARVGHIKKVEPVEGADKLLRFEIDFGEGSDRQIVSGIREYFPEYENLVGKQALYVLNLEPREIKGVISYGMLMAVDGLDGKPVFLVPEHEVNPGSNVR